MALTECQPIHAVIATHGTDQDFPARAVGLDSSVLKFAESGARCSLRATYIAVQNDRMESPSRQSCIGASPARPAKGIIGLPAMPRDWGASRRLRQRDGMPAEMLALGFVTGARTIKCLGGSDNTVPGLTAGHRFLPPVVTAADSRRPPIHRIAYRSHAMAAKKNFLDLLFSENLSFADHEINNYTCLVILLSRDC